MPVLAQAGAETAVNGSAEFWAFLFVGAVALGSALAMVLMRNAVHAALMLVLNFFGIAVLYAILEAQFLFVVQIIVYAGAIMVLFLFVLMLLGVWREESATDRLPGQKIAAVTLGAVLLVGLTLGVAAPYMGDESACNVVADPAAVGSPTTCEGLAAANSEGNVEAVGLLLFTDYVWPFEVMSVLLVVAALGAMILGRRREEPGELVDVVESDSPSSRGSETPQEREPTGVGSYAALPGTVEGER